MKKIFLFAIILGSLLSCQPDEVGDVNTSIEDHTSYLEHTWTLSKIVQKDENAQPGQLASLDISSAVLAAQMSQITFNENTYSADGLMADILGPSGSWSLDNPEFPTRIITDNNSLLLGQSIRSFSDELIIKVDNYSCLDNSLTTSYLYTFTKQ